MRLKEFGYIEWLRKKHTIKWWSCLRKVPCSGNLAFLSTAASLPILLSFPQFSATIACSAFLRHFQLWPPPSWRYPTSRRCWTGGLTEKKFDSRHLIKLWKLYKEGSKYRLTLRQQILEDNIDAAVVGIIVALKHHSSPPLIWVGLVTSWPNLSWVKNLKSGEVFNVISINNICVPPNRLPLPCTALIPWQPFMPCAKALLAFFLSFLIYLWKHHMWCTLCISPPVCTIGSF